MVEEFLIELGCDKNNIGFKYLVDLIQYELEGISIDPLVKNGYFWMSKKYGKTSNSIEKSIQTCINKAWNSGKNYYLNEFFGESCPKCRYKSTNKQFIFTVIDKIKLSMI